MRERVFAVAENGCVELVSRKLHFIAIGVLLIVFWFPVYIRHHFSFGPRHDEDAVLLVVQLAGTVLFIAKWCAVSIAASLVEAEVNRRTLATVLTKPIKRWEYLVGRYLSALIFFLAFVFATAISSYLAAAIFGIPLPSAFLWGVLQHICDGAGWILIGLAFGVNTTGSQALTQTVFLAVVFFAVSHLPGTLGSMIPNFRRIVFFASPAGIPNDFMKSGLVQISHEALVINSAAMIDNILYGAAIFIACAWLFTRTDPKLRE